MAGNRARSTPHVEIKALGFDLVCADPPYGGAALG